MKEHYKFSKMKGRKNPYIKYLKQPVTMRMDRDTLTYFLKPLPRKRAFLIKA